MLECFFKINRRLDYAEQIFRYLIQVYEKKLSDPTERVQCIGAAGETYDSLANVYNEKNDMLRAMPALACYTEAAQMNQKYFLKAAAAGYGLGLLQLKSKNEIEAEKIFKDAVWNFRR